jgi:NAD(P)-dependent dehydrogenase (short-subunit alcohol dehydrogenase family)
MTPDVKAVASHEGKVALCIGSARGIGARTAERLAAGGAKVVIGDIDLASAERTVRGIREAGGEAMALPCDISDESAVAAFVEAAVEKHGGVDLAHLNAADVATGAKDMDLLTADLSLFDRTIAVNLRGNLVCTRQIVPHMLRRGRGAIVYTSSDAVYTTGQSLFFYRMSKAGLNSLMRQVASRWGSQGIRANVVSPGFILMDEGEHLMDDAFQQAHLAATPSTRLGETRDVAAMAEFLLSDLAEWVNGQVISVNGGYQMRA